MLKISISSELAAEHPRFMAGCAADGREVQVFGATEPETKTNRADEESAAGAGADRPLDRFLPGEPPKPSWRRKRTGRGGSSHLAG